jgi:hypothetical protein
MSSAFGNDISEPNSENIARYYLGSKKWQGCQTKHFKLLIVQPVHAKV